jgi:DNA-binding HxlR family transcriptional regulator
MPMMERRSKKRSYRQFCSAARALDVVGERWTLLVVRSLLLGPRRYTDLLEELPGITTNLLAKRLKEMSAAGLIQREVLAAPTRAEVYSLTARGQALEPILIELGRWGRGLMNQPPRRGETVNPGWTLLSLKTLYTGGIEQLELQLHIEGHTFELLYLPKSLRVLEREATRPAAVVTGSHEAMVRLLFKREPLPALIRRHAIVVTGDERALQNALDHTTPA